MARTPSMGLDQNGDGRQIDKYWGRTPQFLHKIEESNIYVCNPEYIHLMYLYVVGDIGSVNISIELKEEIVDLWSYTNWHHSVRPKYINVLFDCLEEYMGMNPGFPPGYGPDDADCLVLNVYNYELSEWHRWMTRNDLQVILHYSDTRRCLPMIPENDCYRITVADQYTTEPRPLKTDGSQYRMSKTYGSCPDVIKYGPECGDAPCPDCLGVNVFDSYTGLMERLLLDSQRLKVGMEFESCVTMPIPPNTGMICEDDICPDCLNFQVWHIPTKTMQPFLTQDKYFLVGKEEGSCAMVPTGGGFGEDCDGACPNCLGLNVYDPDIRGMKNLLLSGHEVKMSRDFESCASVYSVPGFGSDCNGNCPDCMPVYVYDGFTDTMNRLLMSGLDFFASGTMGSCKSEPTTIVWGPECDGMCLNCMSLHVYNETTMKVDRLVMEGMGVNVGRKFESCMSLPTLPDPGMDCGSGMCPDCLKMYVYDGMRNIMIRLSLNGQPTFVSRDVGSCVPMDDPISTGDYTKYRPYGYTGLNVMNGSTSQEFMVFI